MEEILSLCMKEFLLENKKYKNKNNNKISSIKMKILQYDNNKISNNNKLFWHWLSLWRRIWREFLPICGGSLSPSKAQVSSNQIKINLHKS